MFNKYERIDTIQSEYCYPETEVYINFYDVKNIEQLQAIEADLTSVRLAELSAGAQNGRFGITHLKNIHKYIFQDLYPFSGKVRVEEISKGDTLFCKSEFIEVNLIRILAELKSENYLRDYGEDQFISRLSYYISELNVIHPFREGNGRAIREFIRQLAFKNGYELKWYKLDADTLLKATILAVDHQLELLEECIKIAIS